MRIVLGAWDGAGNIPPEVALTEALVARGHAVEVMSHVSTRTAFEAAGARFHPYPTAPDLDHGAVRTEALDFPSFFFAFEKVAATDLMAFAQAAPPDIVLLDCMLPSALGLFNAAGAKTVALLHGAYSAHAPWGAPMDAASLTLSFSYPGFDIGAVFPPNMVFIGPARPDRPIAPWPRRRPDRPLVVASQSSGLQGAPGSQVARLQRICDALADLPIEAVVTTGRGIAPDSLRAADNIAVLRAVDHDAILPGAALFLTHCGHGSIMAAVRAATPMLCLAPGADQPHNAERVVRLGLGEAVEAEAPAAEIRAAVLRLLADPDARTRAAAFRDQEAFAPRLDLAVDRILALANAPAI